MAYFAAKSAKQAAKEAGKTIKIQTVTVELTEISIKLDRLDYKMTHFMARNLLNEISRKIIRLLSNISYIKDSDFKSDSNDLIQLLNKAKQALDDVRPTSKEIDEEVELKSVYDVIEDYFYSINNKVAELVGILERKAMDKGETYE